jgi:hypothetical protein
MTELEINIPAPLPFKIRLRKSLTKPMIIAFIFALMGIGFRGILKRMPELRDVVPIIDVILLVTAVVLIYRKGQKDEYFYMTSIKINPSLIEISYYEKDTERVVCGEPDEFIFEKKDGIYRSGSSYQSSYLNIYKDKNLVLRQYPNQEWTDRKFMEIVHAVTS